ncbi:winged helix-turn-helix transcriptional regulator [Dactylosporangium vinaceum]|uniref:Winged helix-turn-helix domain-containing protein n=1 Tax=Dactylosporangium vinaceum TaxID=53362 RepID=A0ABV5LYZ2_9ACTN|nr:winged helix-turn-helix domain-containing protein [Dactylosporangium vinaceum]UAB95197.1 winged helix-turn-helix transcriptional regulator [Dactylosporangium vinaceum]
MLDRRADVSLYRQLASALRDQIRHGELPPGAELPSESDLSKRHGVSRDVVRDAMAVLRAEGLIATVRGRRAMVREPAVKVSVQAPPAAEITARMPTVDERRHWNILEGVPLITVRTTDMETHHPADRVVVHTAPAPAPDGALYGFGGDEAPSDSG